MPCDRPRDEIARNNKCVKRSNKLGFEDIAQFASNLKSAEARLYLMRCDNSRDKADHHQYRNQGVVDLAEERREILVIHVSCEDNVQKTKGDKNLKYEKESALRHTVLPANSCK